MSDPTRIDSGAGTRLDPPDADGKTRIGTIRLNESPKVLNRSRSANLIP